MEFEQIIKLIQSVSDSKLTQFTYEADGTKMVLKKEKDQTIVKELPMEKAAYISETQIPANVIPAGEGAALDVTAKIEKEGQNIVTSPLVGTFYAAASPEDEPYVKAGDKVKKGQVLGIVEAMKLMNEIESEYDGVVTEILVENGSVIEFGQPMFVIE